MKDRKFGYHWIWIIPLCYGYNLYVTILEKWFPKAYERHAKKHWTNY